MKSTSSPEVVFVTDIPSPHQVELFDKARKAGLDCGVIYVRQSDPGRMWKDRDIDHPHLFIDSGSLDLQKSRAWIHNACLVIISGYSHPLQRQWMENRESIRRPWCFWGERPGFRTNTWVGIVYRKWRLKVLLESAAPIWGIGKWAIEGYRREFGVGRSYFNVPYFSDLARFKYSLSVKRTPYRGRTFLFSGQMIDRKGVLELAEAFLRVARDHSDVRLKFLGDGPLLDRVKKTLVPVAENVEYLGFLDWDFLPNIYASSDFTCVPSKHDGWGMFVPEALASGCPIITTTTTGAAYDLVDDGQNGWLVEPGNVEQLTDAMIKAIGVTPTDYKTMSDNAVRSAQRVDVNHGVEVLKETISKTIDAYGRQ